MQNNYEIRLISQQDNSEVMNVIKQVLTEYGANRPGFAYCDPELNDMFQAFSHDQHCYFVIVRKSDQKIMGGAGIGPLAGGDQTVCELMKMYFLPELRGQGMGYQLLQKLMMVAKEKNYEKCYLETLASMKEARHLYQKCGFQQLEKPMGKTGHGGCDSWYIKTL